MKNKLPAIQFSSPWEAVGDVFVVDEIKRGLFKKELVRAGIYFQPSEPDKPLVFDHELLGHWVATFAQMKMNGVRVPLLMDPSHESLNESKRDAEDRTRGWLKELTLEGDGLFGLFEVIGEDAITSAVRNQVSIVSPDTFIDGTGKEYFKPIINVALTDHPLIPGLGDWKQVAASLGGQQGKENGMWKKLAKALGLSGDDLKDITDENAGEKLAAAIKKMKDDHKAALKAAGKTVKASLEDEGVKEIVDAEVAKQTKVLKASLSVKEIDSTTLELVGENRATKLDLLVSTGRILPAVKDKLAIVFGEGDVLKASLSRGANADNFKEIYAALSENDPIKLGEQTKAQLLTASLGKPDESGKLKDEDNALLKDAQARADAAKK